MAAATRLEYGQSMTKLIFLTADKAGLIAGAALLAALTGCMVDGASQRSGYRGHPEAQMQTTVMIQDDFDYYPGYETYYSRNRHEYIYREGNAWVRRPEPRGVTANVLLAAPSVRLDFHDSPEQHHATVVRSYPKDWKRPDNQKHDDKNDRRDDKKTDKKHPNRKD